MTIQELDISKVIPTPDNPRRKPKESDPEIKELAESIAEYGLLQPVIARPHPTKKGFFDLRAGKRRYIAHLANKAQTILAIVRDLDDAAALEVTVLENLQREDLTPLEEGKSVDLLLKSGKDPKAIASDIGKHVSWVYRRARLAHLSDLWKKAIERAGSDQASMSAGHLELIARFDEKTQDQLFKSLSRWDMDSDLKRFEEITSRHMMFLKQATWKLDDAELVKKAGACTECQKRTSCNPDLFATGDKKVDEADRCLDQACFKKKQAEAFKLKKATVAAKYPDAIEVKTEYYTQSGSKNALRPYDYDKVKKSDPGAVPAITVDGKNPGTLTWVKPKRTSALNQPKEKKESLAAKRAKLNLQRWAKVALGVAEKLKATELKELGKYPNEVLLALIAAFGCGENYNQNPWASFKAFDSGEKDAGAFLWNELRTYIAEDLTYVDRDQDIEKVVGLAELIGMDPHAAFNDICQLEEFKEPPEWTQKAKKNSATKSTKS